MRSRPISIPLTSITDLIIPSIIHASLPKEVPKSFSLVGECELQGKADDKTQQSYFLRCNSGKPMILAGFPHPVVVDFKGARFDKSVTPILGDHQQKNRFGKTTGQLILAQGQAGSLGGKNLVGPLIAATGIRSSKTAFATDLEEDLSEGFPFQVSIGAKILSGFFVEEGDQATVNGMVVEGPVIVASESLIREVTVTVLGADSDTSVSIAARAKLLGDSGMNFEQWVKDVLHLDITAMAAEAKTALQAQYQTWLKSQEGDPPQKKGKTSRKLIKAGHKDDDDPEEEDDDDTDPIDRYNDRIAANAERVDLINAVASEFQDLSTVTINKKEYTMPQLKAHAIRKGWTPDVFELHCRRADYPTPTQGPGIHVSSGKWNSQAVEIGILRACGIPARIKNAKTGRDYGYETMYTQKNLEASDHARYRMTGSFDELCDITIRASGLYPVARTGTDLLAQAFKVWDKLGGSSYKGADLEASGFSTLLITNILENVANKSATAGFDAGETATWRDICGRRPLNDFKPAALYTLDLDGSFKQVTQDGELKHITMRDTKRTIQADTFGAMITIDRKTRRNDDLGLVVQKASSLGQLAVIRIEESVYVLLLSNPGSFFSSGNGNLLTGGSSPLSITSLETAQMLYVNQTLYGKPINVAPSILLTGTSLGLTANNLFRQTQLAIGGGNTDTGLLFVNNQHAGKYRPVESGYLNNTAIRDQDGHAISGQSSTQWYLLGNPNSPQGAAIVIGFLDGRETPFFDQAETQFNIPGGIQMRSYMDWGVAMHLTQLAVKSAGA